MQPRTRRIRIVAALTLLAVVGSAAWWSRHALPRRPCARILADDDGPIALVACVASSARRSSLRNAPAICEVVNTLPSRARIVILTNDRAAFIVASNPEPRRVEFVDLPPEAEFTIWPQDPFVVLRGAKGGPVLLASRDFDRVDDRLIAQSLAKHLGWPLRTSELSFEGGNIVVGQRHVFIGADTIYANAARLAIDPREVGRQFEAEFGRPVLVVGPCPQPIAHIDMMLTPVDERRVMLADSGWGAKLAERQMRDEPDAVAHLERSCQEQFFGNTAIRQLRDLAGKTLRPPKVIGETAAAARSSRAVAAHLDRLAGRLAKWGYGVSRVPCLVYQDESPPGPAVKTPLAKTGEQAEPPRPEPPYPCLTYNNVLLEATPEARVVYLPQYGWPAMDRAAADAWNNLGCRVVPVTRLTTSAMYGGSLRCCVKVLVRQQSDQ